MTWKSGDRMAKKKANIKEKWNELQEMKDRLNAAWPAHTDSLPTASSTSNRKAKLSDVRKKGQDALERIRSGHADEHEAWWEHTFPKGFEKLNKRRQKK